MVEKKELKKPAEKGISEDTDMVIEASEELEIVKSFDELGIREELLRGKQTPNHIVVGIFAYGFNKPSAV